MGNIVDFTLYASLRVISVWMYLVSDNRRYPVLQLLCQVVIPLEKDIIEKYNKGNMLCCRLKSVWILYMIDRSFISKYGDYTRIFI